MKNILIIDTSKKFCNIFILYNNNFFFQKKYSYKNHLNSILLIIENILKNNNINISIINYIIYIINPYNNISHKIGLSISKGISIGLKIPLIQITLFEIISEKIYKSLNIKKNILILVKYYSNLFSWCISNKIKKIWKIKKKKDSKIDNIIKFLKNKKGNWIFNGININNIYKKKFKNINIKNINYINYNFYDLKKIIKLKINL